MRYELVDNYVNKEKLLQLGFTGIGDDYYWNHVDANVDIHSLIITKGKVAHVFRTAVEYLLIDDKLDKAIVDKIKQLLENKIIARVKSIKNKQKYRQERGG